MSSRAFLKRTASILAAVGRERLCRRPPLNHTYAKASTPTGSTREQALAKHPPRGIQKTLGPVCLPDSLHSLQAIGMYVVPLTPFLRIFYAIALDDEATRFELLLILAFIPG